ADEDDDLPARRARRRQRRRRLHRALLRLPRTARRPLGNRAAPADLREGPARPGRPVRQGQARRRAAVAVPRRLPPPRIRAERGRLRRQARHARARGTRGRAALPARRGLARRRTAARAAKNPPLTGPAPYSPRITTFLTSLGLSIANCSACGASANGN